MPNMRWHLTLRAARFPPDCNPGVGGAARDRPDDASAERALDQRGLDQRVTDDGAQRIVNGARDLSGIERTPSEFHRRHRGAHEGFRACRHGPAR